MKKIAILSALLLVALPALAAVSVNTQPASLVTSPMTVGVSSSPIGLFSFKLTGDAAETLSSVAVTVSAAGGSTIAGSDLASLKVYKDNNANNTFEFGTDLLAGTQTTVNVGSATTITTASNNSLTGGGTFFVALSTGSTWGMSAPADSVTVMLDTTGVTTSAGAQAVTAATTSTITAVTVTPSLSTAVASNTAGTKNVVLTFSSATNSPVINAANVNAVLSLNNSHSWLDGNGGLGTATWNAGGTMLTVNLSSAISNPTITVGDTATISGSVIKDITTTNNATGSAVISGNFTAPATPALSTAVAANTGANAGIGVGDSVVLTFNSATNKPVINAGNIAAVLVLNNSHSWLDGASAIGSTSWNLSGTALTVTLSAATSVPTVAVGDTVTTTGSVIKDSTGTNNATGVATITGDFSGNTGGDDGGDGDHVKPHCTNILVNGRLYKLAGDENPTVYLASACKLRPFRGDAVFKARGNKFREIIILDSLAGLEIVTKPALPASGTLVKGSDRTVWFVETGEKRRGFASAEVFLRLGFKFGSVNQISDSDLATLPVDSTAISSATSHPNGSLIKCGGSPLIYQVSGNTETPFTSTNTFALDGHTFNQVATIDCGQFHYTVGLSVY